MSIVPLILAAFGVAAVAGSSKGKSGGRKIIPIDIGAIDKPATSEKFADGRYWCTDLGAYRQPSNKHDGIPRLSGYEYLASVERTATARVAAMRNKINTGPKGSKIIGPMAEDAAQQVWKLGQMVLDASKTKAGRTALANRLGLPASEVNKGIDGIVAVVSKYGGSETGAAVRALTDYASDYMAKLLRDLAVKLAQEVLGAASATALAEAIPIIGQILQVFLKVAEAMSDVKNATFKMECENWISELKKANSALVGYGYPVPWHLFDVWSPQCKEPDTALGYAIGADRWTATKDQDAILSTLKSLRAQWGRIPAGEVSSVTKWWTLANAYMSNDSVKPVFETMCIDSQGGTIASDEQVMVVAAPIAIAYGLDVDAFARELWKNARGWADSPYRQNASITIPKYHCKDGFWASGCDIVGSETVCKNTVLNCYVLNFVDLCAVAFPLAEKMKKANVGTRKKFNGKITPVEFDKVSKSVSDALKMPELSGPF